MPRGLGSCPDRPNSSTRLCSCICQADPQHHHGNRPRLQPQLSPQLDRFHKRHARPGPNILRYNSDSTHQFLFLAPHRARCQWRQTEKTGPIDDRSARNGSRSRVAVRTGIARERGMAPKDTPVLHWDCQLQRAGRRLAVRVDERGRRRSSPSEAATCPANTGAPRPPHAFASLIRGISHPMPRKPHTQSTHHC